MSIKKVIAMSAVAAVMLTACQNDPYGNNGYGSAAPNSGVNKSDVGTVLGGVGGALLGSQVGKGKGQLVGVAAGTLLGAVLGNSIGASMDKTDLMYYNQTSQRALETGPSGQVLPWSNPQTGVSGTVTPSNYYQASNGQYCREYTQTIQIGGRNEQSYGTACRQPDGSWQRIN